MAEPVIKRTEPTTVAYLPMTGPYSQIPEAMGRLYRWVMEGPLEPAGMPIGVYLTDPAEVPEAQAAWEVWAPIAGEEAEVRPDESGVGVKPVPVMTVASIMHRGPYEDVGRTYDRLMTWIGEQGYEVAGPPMEVYYSDPDEVAPEDYLTEVRLGVRKA